jgi:hypothetical protein
MRGFPLILILLFYEVIGITMTYAAFAFSWMSVALFAVILLA